MKCWIAPRDIAPAADWAAEIMDAISAARTMVLVFSASSNQSPQVRREVERAVHKQVDILPFRIEDVLPSKSLEFFLSSQHWMDAFPAPREPHYQRLCSYLKTRLDKTPPVNPDQGPRPGDTAGAGDVAGSLGAAAAGAHGVSAAELRHVEAELAGYIGPLAKHLVKRVALRVFFAPGSGPWRCCPSGVCPRCFIRLFGGWCAPWESNTFPTRS